MNAQFSPLRDDNDDMGAGAPRAPSNVRSIGGTAASHPPAEERSIGELFGDLARETATLVRQEVRLATTELSTKAGHMGRNVGLLAAGGAVAYAGFLAILAAVILAISIALPPWAAALIVGVVVAVLGGLLVQRGIAALKRVDLTPQQTMETLKEDAEWAKQQTQ